MESEQGHGMKLLLTRRGFSRGLIGYDVVFDEEGRTVYTVQGKLGLGAQTDI